MNIPRNPLLSKRFAAPALGALSLVALVSPSCAGPQALQSVAPTDASPASGGLASLVDFLDRNDDGKVEAYEGAEAMLLLTGNADDDGDGALILDELSGFLIARTQEQREEIESTFAELDTDGNGILVEEEVPDELFAIVMGADSDGSGSVNLGELLAKDMFSDPIAEFEQELVDFLASVDPDGDGAFSLDDLPSSERMDFAEDFQDLDRNGDMVVTREELFALVEDEMRGATFDAEGSVAYMNGVIGPTTPGRVLELVLEHPEVETIVLLDVPGSMDDESMVRAAGLVRRMGLGTHMPSDGEVASGGTDFFLAGVKRTADPGARFGVHSWSGFDEEGGDLPRDHPEHELYLDFYRTMGISEDFYWYTLDAAPADGIHWMTEDEIEVYSMVTEGR